MITFLFWNLNNKPLQKTITNLVLQHDVEVLMLVECTRLRNKMLWTLNQQAFPQFALTDNCGLCEKVDIYTRLPADVLTPEFDTDRLTIRHLKLPKQPEILLAVLHFISKMYYDEYDQFAESIRLAEDIRRIEKQVEHRACHQLGYLTFW